MVSCIMPTSDRRQFVPRAIRCYLAQDWPNKELIVLDDGNDKIMDLIPPDLIFGYFALLESAKRTYGDKLNTCAGVAHGEYIIHWDDDDAYASDRITRQIAPLVADPRLQVSGTSTLYYYRVGTETAYQYTGDTHIWLGGIAYPKAVWLRRPFDVKPDPGADNRWLQRIPDCDRHDCADPSMIVASIHPANHAPKVPSGANWKQVDWSVVAGRI